MAFNLTEGLLRTEHRPTKAELLRASRDTWSRPPRWDESPSGRCGWR
jgi:hypothetical protein